MSKLVSLSFALLLPLAVTGCFTSDQPLITDKDSETPIPVGIYSFKSDSETRTFDLSIDGTRTKLTGKESDGTSTSDYLLIRGIGNGYHVAMDSDKDYALIRVTGNQVVEYKESDNCKLLQAEAKNANVRISDWGVVEIVPGDDDTCKFANYDDVAHAFKVLLAAGKLSEGTVYTRQ